MKLYGLKMIEKNNYWVEFSDNKLYLEEKAEKIFNEYAENNSSISRYKVEEVSNNKKIIEYILESANEGLEIDGGIIEFEFYI